MIVRTFLTVWVAVATTTLPAQEPAPAPQIDVLIAPPPVNTLGLGVPPPPVMKWGPWRRGAPIRLDAAELPACTVFAFYPLAAARTAAQDADGDADYLAELQRRFAERGLRVVAAIHDPELPLANTWEPCSVVVDPQSSIALAWGVHRLENHHIVVVDGKGSTVYQGGLDGGLVDAIENALAGKFEAEKAVKAAEWRNHFAQSFDDMEGQQAKPLVDEMLAHAPRDGFAWGMAYLIAATKLADAEAAAEVRKQAIAALANEGRPLAVFADLALRGDPRAPGLANELAAALQMATGAAPRDPFVQLAFLRALVLADKGREVGRHATRTAKLVHPHFQHDLTFAEILLQAKTPAVHRDLVELAMQHVGQHAPPRAVAATRYLVALRCAEDKEAAKKILDAYLGEDRARVMINNDCWYFMTQLPTMGRYDGFALALAERMLEDRASMDYFELDTAALAMFLSGRFQDAAELQGLAIEKSGMANPAYTERLQRYKAAAEAAPR